MGFLLRTFISARRSVQLESERACKALWLGVEDVYESRRVDLHPTLVGSEQADSQSMPIALPSKMCRPSSLNPSLLGTFCLAVCGEGRWKSYGERAKLMSLVCVTRDVLVKAWVRGLCSCWTTWPRCWALQRAVVPLPTSTTLVAKAASSRSSLSPSPSADGLDQKMPHPLPPSSFLLPFQK